MRRIAWASPLGSTLNEPPLKKRPVNLKLAFNSADVNALPLPLTAPAMVRRRGAMTRRREFKPQIDRCSPAVHWCFASQTLAERYCACRDAAASEEPEEEEEESDDADDDEDEGEDQEEEEEEEGSKQRKAAAGEDDDSAELAKMMMSKKNYRLYQRMQHSNKKKTDASEALRQKRRKLRK